MGREVLYMLSGQTPTATENAIRRHLPRGTTSVLYPGPADDVAPIVPLLRHYGYSHFVYIDVAPYKGDSSYYGLISLPMLVNTVTMELETMNIAVTRVIHDPVSSRMVWLLTYRNRPLVLEYFYSTDYTMVLTQKGRNHRAVMMRKLANVTGMYVSPGAGSGPRKWFSKEIFPSLKLVIEGEHIPGHMPDFKAWKKEMLPKQMWSVNVTGGSKGFMSNVAKHQAVRMKYLKLQSLKRRLSVKRTKRGPERSELQNEMNEAASFLTAYRTRNQRPLTNAQAVKRSLVHGTPARGGLIPF